MIILTTLVWLYFIIGTIYGLWILFFGQDEWYLLPINIIGGPLVIVYVLYIVAKGKKLPFRGN